MPNPNAIVSRTIRLEPAIDRAPEEMLRAEPGIFVALEGERRVRLDASNSRSAGFARVLDGLSQQGLPVYLEVDPSTDAVTRLLIPQVARVVSISPGDDYLDIELEPSHARHQLQMGQDDSASFAHSLQEALQGGLPILVTEDDAHQIIDVRGFALPPGEQQPPFPFLPPKPSLRPPWPWSWLFPILRPLWWWVRWPWWWFQCPSASTVQAVFSAMAAASCDPLTVPAPCIPFLYPDDGCWGRAHEMCRLMISRGLSPQKVWIDHSSGAWLHVNTKNNPQCYVDWSWHVAPTLCVRGPRLFQTDSAVIDPALFTTPVSEAIWKGVQGDLNATLTHTRPEQFSHGGGTDPTYAASDTVLARYRLALQNRANVVGPPPYAGCP
jgi:hypothetical protein